MKTEIRNEQAIELYAIQKKKEQLMENIEDLKSKYDLSKERVRGNSLLTIQGEYL